MSSVERPVSFPLAGALSWAPGAPPPWRRHHPAPQPNSVVWSADFAAGLYTRGGAPATLAETISCARASDAIMLDAAGACHLFGPGEPPLLPGLGLDIWGQFTNKNAHYNASPVSLAGLSEGTGSPIANGYLSVVDDAAALAAILPGIGNGKAFCVSVPSAATTGLYVVSGTVTTGNVNPHTSSVFARGNGVEVLVRMNQSSAQPAVVTTIEYRRIASADMPVNANRTWALSISHIQGAESIVWFALGMMSEGTFAPPPIIVSGGSATRQSTDVAMSDFVALRDAYGLNAGFSGRDIIHLGRLSDASHRCIWSRGVDADNCIRLEIRTDNKLRLTVRSSGVSTLILETLTGFSMPGTKIVDTVCQGGFWSLHATETGIVNSSAAVELPDLQVAYIGRAHGAPANYLNGSIEFSHIRRY